jgi:hypothetical protein
MFVNLEADKHEVYVAVYASLQGRN